jgi:P pilus assembly chaperone PapD
MHFGVESAWLSFSSQAMFIDNAIINFLPNDTPRHDVRVFNNKNETLYVKIELMTVENPGTEQEKRIKIVNPENAKILVTPAKMVIPPNSIKTLRVVNLDEELAEEKIYRINITPIPPPLQVEEFSGSKVRIVTAYQILALVAPLQPNYDLIAERNGKTLTLTNKGNSYVLITQGRQCPRDAPSQDSTGCVKLQSKRLYSGNQFSYKLSFDTPVQLDLQSVLGSDSTIIP